MKMAETELCTQVDEQMSEVLEGVASDALYEHLASCERCRDARHDAELVAARVGDAALDYRLPEGLEARVLASLPEERKAELPGTRERNPWQAPPLKIAEVPLVQRSQARHRGVIGFAVAGALAVGAAWLLRSRAPLAPIEGEAWQGHVASLQRAFGSPSGLSSCDRAGACVPLAEGQPVPAGARLETDGSTRALLKLGDGSTLSLDRATRLELDASAGHRARLVTGRMVAELASTGSADEAALAPAAVLDTPAGRAELRAGKLSLLVEPEQTRAEVSRGVVKLVGTHERGITLRAGEAGQITRQGEPRLEHALDLGRSLAWSSESFEPATPEQAQGSLGSLAAKRPRDQQELSGAVQLTEHDVKVQIVGSIARTEVEEVFTNQTDDVLEGIYRFPLPPGAQIERLALDVDGKLVDGAYVERERAAAIWRGAIVNAGAQKPQEEIIWVPGPWRDPALLEWQRGNRFELRIYPIPKHGSRRVVIAYTERLEPTEGRRQYVYRLPRDPGGSTRIERFSVDVQVRGHDEGQGVHAQGYALKTSSAAPGVARLAYAAEGFAPAGDLVLDYQLADATAPLRAWAYQAQGERSYVAMLLRPELPRRAEYQPRDYAIVVDSSRSMIGENYRRALAVVERTIREMDRQDRVSVLACDSECQSWPGGYLAPGDAAAEAAGRFLRSIEPEGASDLALAVERAVALRGHGAGRALRLLYVGDGTPTVGPIHPALLRRAVSEALPRGASLSAVAIGSDADRDSLQALTEAAGGVTVAFSPGQSAADVAFAVLGASYGYALKNARLTLPDGMSAVAPERIGSIAAGAEELVVARLDQPEVDGYVVLSGELAGEPFEQSYPLHVVPVSGESNAFVPRLYASVAIAELDQSMDEGARRRSIELSTRFNVASRYTSLLVLESPAMFKAFGLDNQRGAPEWSGTLGSQEAETTGDEDSSPAGALEQEQADKAPASSAVARAPTKKQANSAGPEWGMSEGRASSTSAGGTNNAPIFDGQGSLGNSRPGAAPPAPAAPAPARRRSAEPDDSYDFGLGDELAAPRSEARRAAKPRALEQDPSWRAPPAQPFELPARRMIPMHRVYERIGTIDPSPRLLDVARPAHLAQLEARASAQELNRGALKELYAADFLAGELELASQLAERWSEKDPLDPDALTARADLAAQRGQRELAIRILGSVVDVRPGDYKSQWRLARLHRWSGDPARGCRHSLAVAQLRLRDAKLVAEALHCAREVGQKGWVEDLIAALSPDVRQQALSLEEKPRPGDELSGDLRVQATWQGAEHDLDLVILHPEGYRVSWLGAPTRAVISATDVLSVHREGLALRGAEAGQYAIEVVRSSATSGPVRGSLSLRVGKAERSIPFVLEGERTRVATARIRLEGRLVPVAGWVDGEPLGF
jgi:hypothetical protein